MRALIVGGHGAIGSALARHADALGIETHVAVRTDAAAERLHGHPNIVRHSVDLHEGAAVEAVLARVRPDWIAMAAFPSEQSAQRPEARRALLHGMSDGMLGLLEACSACGFAGTLTWIGSASVYGPGLQARAAGDPLQPHSWRGAVKAAESLLAAQFAAAHGLRLVELRVFTAYGPFEQRDRLLPALLRAALCGSTVPIARTPSSRDWTHLDDIALGCLASVAAPAGTFNLCTGRLTDTRALAGMLEGIVGATLVAPEPWCGHDHYGEVGSGVLAGAADGFGWRPTLDLEAGLRRTWAWAQTAPGRSWLLEGMQ